MSDECSKDADLEAFRKMIAELESFGIQPEAPLYIGEDILEAMKALCQDKSSE